VEEIRRRIMARLEEINIPGMDPAYAGVTIHVGMSHFSPKVKDMGDMIHQAQEAHP
jgi:hypothetical protein